MEQRKNAWFAAQFRVSFSSANVVPGEDTLSDLSIRGCRVFSLIEVVKDLEMQPSQRERRHD